MPDAPELPADLIQLQRDYDQAHADVLAYLAEVETQLEEADHSAVEAGQEPDTRPGYQRWTEFQTAKLQQLRNHRLSLVMAIHRHPTMASARESGNSREVEEKRRKAGRGE